MGKASEVYAITATLVLNLTKVKTEKHFKTSLTSMDKQSVNLAFISTSYLGLFHLLAKTMISHSERGQ